MNKLRREIEATLAQEKKTYDDGMETDDVVKGWVESLEYVLNQMDRLVERRTEWKGVCDTNDKRLNLGRVIICAIAEYDEDYYEWVTRDAHYPCNDEDKYHDGTADHDDDVDVAEMNAIIDLLTWVVTKHHPHKKVGTGYHAMLDNICSKFNGDEEE